MTLSHCHGRIVGITILMRLENDFLAFWFYGWVVTQFEWTDVYCASIPDLLFRFFYKDLLCSLFLLDLWFFGFSQSIFSNSQTDEFLYNWRCMEHYFVFYFGQFTSIVYQWSIATVKNCAYYIPRFVIVYLFLLKMS